MFGIELSAPAEELLRDVESAYGKPVSEIEENTWEPSRYGQSIVKPDGTPTITINSSTGRTEATIVHELLHLKLRAEGFPILGYEFPADTNTTANKEYMIWIGAHLRDPIQHWIFYPRMQDLGVDPDMELRIEFEAALERGYFLNLNAATKSVALTLYYLKAALQLNDPKMLNRIVRWYKKRDWKKPLSLGEQLVQVVLDSNPQTPREEIAVFLRCLNLLQKGAAKFELSDWNTQTLGTFDQSIAIIKISPPR
jgi:hypothetical protein